MGKTLLSTATALGLMALSPAGLGQTDQCQFIGHNTDPDKAVVFSVAGEQGFIDSSYVVKPGESAVIDLPSASQVIIGATPVQNVETSTLPVKQPYAGLLSYKGGVVQAGTHITAVFPGDFELAQ